VCIWRGSTRGASRSYLRFALHRDLVALGPGVAELIRDKRVAQLVLKAL
jgi:hypothetical protein